MKNIASPLCGLCALLYSLCDFVSSTPQGKEMEKVLEVIKGKKKIYFESKGTVELPKSDDIGFTLKSLYLAPETVFIDFRTTGGQTDFIIRKGNKSLVWHPVEEEWIDPQLLGKGASGNRLQNPMYIIKMLEKNKNNVRSVNSLIGQKEITVEIDADSLKDLTRDTIETDDINWEQSKASITIFAHPDSNEPTKIKCLSELNLKEGTGYLKFEFGLQYPADMSELIFEITEAGKAKRVAITESARKELKLVAE